jgi:hypothetical protein
VVTNNLPARHHKAGLPGTIQKLREYVLLSSEKLKAYKLVLKSASRQSSKEIYEQTLAEGQIVGESTLYAEAKMGEMLEAIPRRGKKYGSTGGTIPSLPIGVDKKASHYAQQLARHQDAIKEAIAEAKERGEIPTRREVLGVIRRSQTESKHTPKATPALPAGRYNVARSRAQGPSHGAAGCEGVSDSPRPARPKPRRQEEMNIVRDYSRGIDSREWARIRSKWQAEIEKLATDDEVREWFRRTWIVIGRLVGDHRRALRLRKKGTPDVGDWRVDLR